MRIIQDVIDPDFGTNYQAAGSGSYAASISPSDQQNATLTASFNSAGSWMIVVKVTVTFPDGYTRVYRKEVKGVGGRMQFAGAIKIDAALDPRADGGIS